jgi:thiamine-monophosphate kinase
VDILGSSERRHFLHPRNQLRVRRRVRHSSFLLITGAVAGEVGFVTMSASNGPDPSPHSQRPEDDLVERIASVLAWGGVPRGERHIGDDAAVLAPTVGETIISVDVCVAGVHLDTTLYPIEDLGFKAITTAVSDIAAMGGRVRACVVGVMAPPGTDLLALHQGMAEASHFVNAPIVGGDVTRANDIAVSVTVLGEVPSRGSVLRSGARAGDVVFVTGPLGRSAAGARRRRAGASLDDELVLAHRRPWPCLAEGVAARDAGASAMMDVSDGLALDLHRLADESSVGFRLTNVPVADGATLEEALSGGEDYELLVVSPEPETLRSVYATRGLDEPIEIGVIIEDVRDRTFNGEQLGRRGWQHQL